MMNILFRGITWEDDKEIFFTLDQILFTYLEETTTYVKINGKPVPIRFDSIDIVNSEYCE